MKYFQSLVTEGCAYDIFHIISDEIWLFILIIEKYKVLHHGDSDHLPENSIRIKWLKNSLAEKFSFTAGTIIVNPKSAFHYRFSV